MIKQLVALVIFSTAIILSMSHAQQGVQWLVDAHEWISQLLTDIFSPGQAGSLARGLIALLSIPFIAGLIPTLVYWVIKRSWFPYFMEIVWVIWLIQAGALMVLYRA
ncbi:MAG: hypothetical protein KIT56_07630 [Gammaproteobacteria bacterium]|nr:hypothetical protein [Gammaproteobacteria bacterium]MCW5583730.1 hypothetical protein [Gammaproteobacteria bacterium]